MKLKISIFSIFIPLLLNFSYSAYGDVIYKNVFLFNLESNTYEDVYPMDEGDIFWLIENNLEKSRTNYFIEHGCPFDSIYDVKFRFYEKTKGGNVIRLYTNEDKEPYEEFNAINEEPDLGNSLDLDKIKNRNDIRESTKNLVEKMFSNLESKRF
ncbi:MAG: hypothetical protein PUP46_07680 [Endozoicomonas sp. (ex Botrylloides leachii)]|nr:hypothetical protein [Endozoicomonas sp. (ex Botrylloides leachii)]